jgi:hypothetical protein
MEEHVHGFGGKHDGKKPLGKLRRCGKIILKYMLEKYYVVDSG